MKKLAAVVTTTALAATGLVSLATPAGAAPDCGVAVTDDDGSPKVLAVGTTKTRTEQIAVQVKDPCGYVDEVYLPVASPRGKDTFSLGDPLDRADGYVVFGVQYQLNAEDLYLDEAGLWKTTFRVHDKEGKVDDVTEAGPDFRVVRGSRVSINATPEPVRRGRTITVKGDLERADWERGTYRGYTKQQVTVQTRTPKGSTYRNLKTVTTDSHGRLRTTVKAAKDVCFRFVFAGTGTTQPATSHGDCVDVR